MGDAKKDNNLKYIKKRFENAFDVKMLMMKFPELKEVDYDE